MRHASVPNIGMRIEEVHRVLRAMTTARCRFWIEGGWGVDALVGRQTRPHRDLDVDVDSRDEALVLSVLDDLGYTIETDWRPNRVELVAPHRGWVDVHPFEFDESGGARQAALDGGWHEIPDSYFTHGHLEGIWVPCVSEAAQRRFHTGYEPRDVDKHDLALLDALSERAAGA